MGEEEKGHKESWHHWSFRLSLRSTSPLRSEAVVVGIADGFPLRRWRACDLRELLAGMADGVEHELP